MDLTLLKAELTDDPLEIGYADLSDAEAADLINARIRPGRQEVPAKEVRRYVLLHGLWPAIQSVAASSTDPVHRGTAITILQTLAPDSFDTIRMQDDAVRAAVSQMLQTMVDAGAISDVDRNAMIAMGDAAISRAEELGLGHVHHLDVAAARQGA